MYYHAKYIPLTRYIEIFKPEVEDILKKKIGVLKEERFEVKTEVDSIMEILKRRVEYLRRNFGWSYDEANFQYRTGVVFSALDELHKLMAIDMEVENITKALKLIDTKGHNVDGLTEEDIEMARRYPVEKILNCQYRETGGRKKCLCPFHKEKTPSFVIYPNNTYYCFGCGASGDSIKLVMALNRLNFVEAVKSLK